MIGEIKMVANENVPDGHLECDGKAYLKTARPDLYNEIGSRYGGNETLFCVPDMRGIIVRGWNHGAPGRDPDVADRTSPNAVALSISGNISCNAQSKDITIHNGDDYGATEIGMKFISGEANGCKIVDKKANNIVEVDTYPGEADNDPAAWNFSGDEVGTRQDHAFQGHGHNISRVAGTGSEATIDHGYATRDSENLVNYGALKAKTVIEDGYQSPKISSETRPKNISMMYVIET